MATAPQIDIIAPKRVPFDNNIVEMGVDYSGATAAMEIRAAPGDQGAPLVSLGMSSSGGQGLTIDFDDAWPDPVDDEPADATIVGIIINETTLEGLAYGADPEADVTLFYDIHIDPAGGKKFMFARGRFVVSPGVTL